MKIIASLRFIWAITIIFNAFSSNIFISSGLETYEIVLRIAGAIILLTFISYCIIMGLQDWKGEQLIHAKYFNVFGLVLEILILMATSYIFIFVLWHKIEVTQKVFFTIRNAGLLILIYIDIRTMWIDKREYSN